MPSKNKAETMRLTESQARHAAIHAQGLAMSSRLSGVDGVLRTVGAVQLDTISVLARSHELVVHARVDGLDRATIEAGLWGDPPHTFEYWSHAACILPLDLMPWFAFRRRFFRRRGIRWHDVPPTRTLNQIRRRLADGPATATALGGAKKGGPWWDWSEVKIGVEWLLDIGDVVCTKRTGWRRVYSLNADGREHDDWVTKDGVYGPTDEECLQVLVRESLRTLGVGTLGDVADVHRLAGQGSSKRQVADALTHLIDQGEAVACTVAGWDEPAFMHAGARTRAITSRTTMLSPFDSLVWHRDRVSRIFGMDYRLEAYTPAAKRVHGYFAMPVLHDGRLVARVDPTKRDKGAVLHAATVTMQPGYSKDDAAAVAASLRTAAGWVGAADITIGDVVPAAAAPALRRGLAG